MLLREVEYARPSSVEEAIRLLGAHEGARALAGGQTLVNVMKARAASPDVLVDLNRLEELRAITVSGDTLQLGAMATYTQMMASSEVDVSRPILAEVAAQIADVQVRNRGTIGGNICSNDPTNHLPPLLVALGASMTIRGAAGERTVPAEEFFLGVYMTVVGEGELLLSVSVPAAANAADGFSSITIGRDGTCLANAAASLAGDSVRIALGCVDAVPVLLTPTSSDENSVRQAVEDASARSAVRRARLRGLSPPPGRRLRGARRRAGAGARQVSAEPATSRTISVDVNGDVYERDVDARRLLVHFIRDELELTGTHIGCDTGNCGACTVHLDGQAVKSCMLLAVQADGAKVRTVEGLAPSRRRAEPAAAVLLLPPRPPVRLLHARDADERLGAARAEPAADGGRGTDGDPGEHLPLHRLPEHRRGDRERRRSPSRSTATSTSATSTRAVCSSTSSATTSS